MYSQKRYSLVSLTTTLLLALIEQSGIAFTITPKQPGASIAYDQEESYVLVPGSQGKTELSPSSVTSVPRNGSQSFLDKLREDFPDWVFNPAPNDLTGNFKIQVYDAVGETSRVGAFFQLKYIPGGSDPTPSGNELHWIQRVVNNHNITDNPGYGNLEDVIDRLPGNSTPFYDLGANNGTNERTFVDLSQRNNPQDNHYWSAELHLVELIAPKEVRIYNGVSWGWTNTYTPPSDPCSGGSGGGGCFRAFTDQDVTFSSNIPAPSTSVPEYTSRLGLLALGAWGVFQGLKIIKDKQ